MKTFVFRLSRHDGKQHLGELLNVTVQAKTYSDAAMMVIDQHPEYYIVGHMVK
jgi:hypothetical protein